MKYLALVIAAVIFAAGCQSAANTNTAATANTNTASSNADAASTPPANTSTALEPGDPAGSPTEVYKAAYMARKNCDVPGLKKIMSKDILRFLADMGKTDKKSLDDELKDICTHPQNPSQSVRNEKIDGDRASLEYLDEDGSWRKMDFVKEDGAWRLSMGSGDQPPAADDAPVNKEDKDDNRS